MQLDELERKVIDIIDRAGWMVMQVSPSQGDEDPRWSLTQACAQSRETDCTCDPHCS